MRSWLNKVGQVLTVAGGLVGFGHTGAQGAGREVTLPNQYGTGAIVIHTQARKLYFTLSAERAVEYDIAVGDKRNQWFGTSYISGKQLNPHWAPTPSMRRKNPNLPKVVPPGPRNPLGAGALYLDWGTYRIHGTNRPGSIGGAVSNGCFRMHNADIRELFERVHVGAPVFVEH